MESWMLCHLLFWNIGAMITISCAVFLRLVSMYGLHIQEDVFMKRVITLVVLIAIIAATVICAAKVPAIRSAVDVVIDVVLAPFRLVIKLMNKITGAKQTVTETQDKEYSKAPEPPVKNLGIAA